MVDMMLHSEEIQSIETLQTNPSKITVELKFEADKSGAQNVEFKFTKTLPSMDPGGRLEIFTKEVWNEIKSSAVIAEDIIQIKNNLEKSLDEQINFNTQEILPEDSNYMLEDLELNEISNVEVLMLNNIEPAILLDYHCRHPIDPLPPHFQIDMVGDIKVEESDIGS
ncbi:MAG: hypothetical protein ACK4OM_07560 [Alphaproteobacteria bacterium]